VLRLIDDSVYRELFREAKKKGIGIELNTPHIGNMSEEERYEVLRPYRAAKAEGCKFYLGSDAHTPAELDGAMSRFAAIIDALELTEDDKFHFGEN
jgi:histidinol phosphatase-like PHP family hydrolase